MKDKGIKESRGESIRLRHVPLRNQLHHHDPSFLDKLIPFFGFLGKYFSYEVVGLDKIPDSKASLVVMNHGVIPYHGFLFAKELIQKRHIYPRGLGAGFLFSIPFVRDFFLKGGAVNANPRNAIALLKQGNCVMLAPGGIYEGLICQPGMKRIPWERRTGFVRLAVESKVPIIPTYCDGINNVYFNSRFLLKLRIKILEATRFSIPLFWGIGLLPLPKKLIHYVGRPLSTRPIKGESVESCIRRVHHLVMETMHQLAE